MNTAAEVLGTANELYIRSGAPTSTGKTRPPVYKAIGISLAITSGVFIGVSFVLKKRGLLKANVKYDQEAGEGYAYLKNAWWWSGMTLMIIGEIFNFVAYGFVDAILVTTLGATSVVITAVLSAIFLKERLSLVGKIGCFICVVGSIVIVMNAPAQSSVADIQGMKHFVVAPGFLSYAGVILLVCAFIGFWAGPRYGKKSMLVYLSICSLIGGLSVVCTQGLGAAIIAQIGGEAQFNQWFLYVVLVIVIATLVTEIIFLNKALNIFNAALVTPTYYVFFTTSTIITSAVLFRGFKGSPTSITTVVMGFFQICAGVILLQLSKSAKDVPDTAVFTGDLDQARTIAEQEQPESEPKADAIRGAAALIRRISATRQKMEEQEAKRIQEERKSELTAIGEEEGAQYEWDGLRRRRTTLSGAHPGSIQRRKTLHPPLGLTKFPDLEDENSTEFEQASRSRAKSTWLPGQRKNLGGGTPDLSAAPPPLPLTEISLPAYKGDSATPSQYLFPKSAGTPEDDTSYHSPLHPPAFPDSKGSSSLVSPKQPSSPIKWTDGVDESRPSSKTLTSPDPGLHGAKRQFSFTNVFHRSKEHAKDSSRRSTDASAHSASQRRPSSRLGLHSRQGSNKDGALAGPATEEERLGLVKGDSSAMLPLPDYTSDEESAAFVSEKMNLEDPPTLSTASRMNAPLPPIKSSEDEDDQRQAYEERSRRWRASRSEEPEQYRTLDPRAEDAGRRKDDRDMKDGQGRGQDQGPGRDNSSRGPGGGGGAFI